MNSTNYLPINLDFGSNKFEREKKKIQKEHRVKNFEIFFKH